MTDDDFEIVDALAEAITKAEAGGFAGSCHAIDYAMATWYFRRFCLWACERWP